MPKSTKSSASSATRKKKAQKAAKKGGNADGAANGAPASVPPAQRGQKKVKGKGKEPKKKIFIPPTKPKQDVIDPLDSLGLANMLPSDLVVLLRKAGKKDVVTRSRALEGLLEWIQAKGDEQEEDRESALVLAIPCWAHLFPRLSISPNRRLRQLTGQVNSLLLSNQSFFPELLAQSECMKAIVGGMLVLAFDPDRQVARVSKVAWEQYTDWNANTGKVQLDNYLEFLLSHISSIVFHTSDEVNPTAPTATLSTARDAKNRDDVNVEEDAEGTDARLVYGALGALSWLIASRPPSPGLTEQFEPLMTSHTLWTSLSRHSDPEQRCLGSLSPIVRSASWHLVYTLTTAWKELLDKCLPILGFIALKSAFDEVDGGVANQMREGLVTLVRTRPEVWRANPKDGDEDDDQKEDDHDDDEDDDDDDEEEDGDEEGSDVEEVAIPDRKEENQNSSSAAPTDITLFKLFLKWLSAGLKGAHGNYNIIIVLLSTIPVELNPPTAEGATSFLIAMYAPIDERGIEGREALRAFVRAFLECFVWSSARVSKSTSLEEAVEVTKEIQTFYTDFVGSTLPTERSGQSERIHSVGEDQLRNEVGALLRKLGNVDVALASPLLEMVRVGLSQTIFQPSHDFMDRNVALLKYATTSTSIANVSSKLREAVYELVADLSMTTANVVASGEAQEEGIRLLCLLLTDLPSAHNEETLSSLKLVFDLLLNGGVPLHDGAQAAFFAAYLSALADESSRWQSWTMLLDSVCLHKQVQWSKLRALVSAMQGKEDLFEGASPSLLDEAMVEHFEEDILLVSTLMERPRPYLQLETVTTLLEKTAEIASPTILPLLSHWLRADSGNAAHLLQQEKLKGVVPSVVSLALLGGDQNALTVWNLIKSEREATDIGVRVLSKQLVSTQSPLRDVMGAMASLSSSTKVLDLLPDQSTMADLFAKACQVTTPSTLAIFDPLVSSCQGQGDDTSEYDDEGLTSYCRCSIALLEAMEDTGYKATWALPHVVFLALAGEDAATLVSGAGNSHFFKGTDGRPYINRAVRVATGVFSSGAGDLNELWYTELIRLLKSDSRQERYDELQSILADLWVVPSSVRIFARLLKGVVSFSGAGEKEGILLLRLAQSVQDSKPSMASAIYASVKELVLETPVYDRIRNELAARLAGVSPSKAATEGVKILRMLIDVAPPIESSISLIPQQRCIFLLQNLQKWTASDDSEEFPPELHTLMIQILSHLLPIVQDMPGSHLPFICDLMDVNLSEGLGNIVCVYHTLHLVALFHELAERNTTLREVWNESKLDIFENVHQLFLAPFALSPDSDDADEAKRSVGKALAYVVRIGPEALFTSAEDVGPLLKIIVQSGEKELQILAYRLLSNNIRERVKEVVVEVALGAKGDEEGGEDGDEGKQTTAPPPLEIKIADQITSLLSLEEWQEGDEYALLLAWMALFEYFEESSLPLKAIYTSQIQSLGLVETSLLPLFFAQTQLRLDPSRWALDEVYLDELEPSQENLAVLTTHVFYRSLIHVPNLIRESFNGIKDRQQSIYLRNFLVKNLTPLLSLREFSHLRDEETINRITDENMSIKVLAGSTNEVIATYTIDEYPLEISIAMPNDYPLRNVEIKDLKKIGVSEGTWRAWILSIRQLIAGKNGLIFDALMLFKRNVEAKFSGFDEDSTCAVCYSIVSPTDHSLPTKPCKTCKKKFHASCLYKWVSTSGSSTCPLCRSIL
ncbi:hypothetical protein CBS101457_004031 [Exobasidium rhododendri]|nr:hypothetical protein CBS101457_004031 [Exobasidium rhododendri]